MSEPPRLARRPLLPPLVADAAVALGAAAFAVAGAFGSVRQHEHVQVPVVAVLVAMGLVLFPRRRFPGSVLAAVAMLVGGLATVRSNSDGAFIPLLVSSYSAAVYGSRRLAVSLTAVVAVILAVSAAMAALGVDTEGRTSALQRLLLAAAGAWVVGWIIRRQFATRAAQIGLLAERVEVAAERQRQEAERVRLGERLRIARELHDIVAHHITVVVIQAQGAQRIAERDADRARQAMADAERTARAALDEMRRLLNLLRAGEPDEPAVIGDGSDPSGMALGAAPAEMPGVPVRESRRKVLPGVADIVPLAEQLKSAGLDVTIRVTGQPEHVPDDVGLAAYRIVQEALTNVLKHAGNARAAVCLDFTNGVEITVTDNGRGAAAHLDEPTPDNASFVDAGSGASLPGRGQSGGGLPGARRGITGMAERAAAAGGSLTAGPRVGGGFEVHALMPLADT